MEGRNEAVASALLSRLPQPAKLATYQEEVRLLLTKNDERLRQNKWTVRRVWIFVILTSIPSLYLAGANFHKPEGNWFLGSVFFWVLFGAIEIAKYHNNQGRVELLKEIKQLQLQVLELNAQLIGRGAPASEKP